MANPINSIGLELLRRYGVSPTEIEKRLIPLIKTAKDEAEKRKKEASTHFGHAWAETIVSTQFEMEISSVFRITVKRFYQEPLTTTCRHCHTPIVAEFAFSIQHIPANKTVCISDFTLHLLTHGDLPESTPHLSPKKLCDLFELGNTTLEDGDPLALFA